MLTPIKPTRRIEKPIFFSSSYLESSIGFCDLCFAILDSAKEVFYQCQSCNDFIACLVCLKDRNHRLISHSSEHLFSPYKPRSNVYWMNRHLSIQCNLCHEKNFFGKRYRCRHCLDYNVCSKCLNHAKQIHYLSEKHLWDLIPNSTKIRFNHYFLALRSIQFLRYKNADSLERDPITGWTIDEATMILEQTAKLCILTRREAIELFENEDIDASPSIIEHEKSTEILIPLS